LIPTSPEAASTEPPAASGEPAPETTDNSNVSEAGPGPQPVPGASFREVPIDSITPNPKQPREIFDEEALAAAAAGEEGAAGGAGGNRWPRQETLALLKIRSEMDAAFREAALKGPLWEEVSRY